MEQAIIYCIKTGETIHYIGKTISETNAEGGINRSDLQYPYNNPGIREVFMGDSVSVVPIKNVPITEWYDEKLLEVVEKHKDSHPLLNAQWMLDGKRGYWEGTGGFWEGKTRDAHTLKRLSESKHRKVLQYDLDGNLIKIWDSRKEAATQVFGDYRVVNGSAASTLYGLLTNANPKNRLRLGSYWFSEADFDRIPVKISIPIMAWKYKNAFSKKKSEAAKNAAKNRTTDYLTPVYTVIHYNINGNVIRTYANTHETAYELKTSVATIQRFCRGVRYNKHYILKYGEKTMQHLNPKYPDYVCKPIKRHKKPSKAKKYQRTKTLTTVELFEDGKLVRIFDDVRHAAIMLGLGDALIRACCTGKKHKKNVFDLRYGKKVKIYL